MSSNNVASNNNSNSNNNNALQKLESSYATALLRSLKYGGVNFLRYTTIDVCNNLRCKVVPIDHLLKKKDNSATLPFSLTNQVSIAKVCYAGLPSYADYMINGTDINAQNVLSIKPDLNTLQILPYATKTANVIGTIHDQYTNEQSPLCTRSILQNVIDEAANSQNIEFAVGAEIEFSLVNAQTHEPIDNSVFANTTTLNNQEEFITELYDQLQLQSIDIELIHSESGPGQVEIVLKYLNNPIQLADNVVMAKETIIAVARKYKMKAMFLPKYDMTKAGNGLHVHMSFRDKATHQPLFSNRSGEGNNNGRGLSMKGSSFVEGILQHLPSIMGVTLPTTNSFKRIGVGCWTGSTVSWAVEDKECGIRICSNLMTKEWDHVECKLVDNTCNIYMALSALLVSGLDGIKQGLQLRPSLHELKSEPEPESLLPSTVQDAFNQLEQDTLLRDTFGPTLMKGYLALRRNEAERSSSMELDDEIKEALNRS